MNNNINIWRILFSDDIILKYGKLLQEITTELRNFESKFSTKIELIYNFDSNHLIIENNLHLATKNLKVDILEHLENTTGLYPYVIGDQMFFLKCSKTISKYEDFILTSLIQSGKGLEITKSKLSNIKFIENALESVIAMEKKKFQDFEFKWELWTKAYLLYDI